MDIRIRKVFYKGYLVEKKVAVWKPFGLRYKWVPFITYSGSDDPFYFKKRDRAVTECLLKIKFDLIE